MCEILAEILAHIAELARSADLTSRMPLGITCSHAKFAPLHEHPTQGQPPESPECGSPAWKLAI
jgi:hypothetical protein